jgi:4-hydroxybenzoate polyprenyltransferase
VPWRIGLEKRPGLKAPMATIEGLSTLRRRVRYEEHEEYVSRCHLCLHARSYLAEHGEFRKLKPVAFCKHVEDRGERDAGEPLDHAFSMRGSRPVAQVAAAGHHVAPSRNRGEIDTMLKPLLETMRPKQWAKNLFVFAGLIFGKKLFYAPLLGRNVVAFLLFCLISSSIYVINDLADIQKDRQHPTKRRRPLASGRLQPRTARIAATVFVALSIPLAFVLGLRFGLLAAAYLATMIAYSLLLKNLVIVDVFVVSAGYVLRVAGGVLVTGVPFSPWLYVCTTLLALFISFSRRRHELMILAGAADEHRSTLNEYTPHLLDEMISVVTSTTVIAYSLYTFSAPNVPSDHSMMLTVPFVLYGIFRYLYLIHVKNEGGTPEELLFKDKPLLADIALWGLTALFVLYIK